MNIKQLNEFESNLVKFFRNEIATAVKGVYFQTRNPVYNSYSAKALIKTMKWSSISNNQLSDSNDFTLNSDSITIRQSGVYLFYYQEIIRGSDNDKQKGYISFDVKDSLNHGFHNTKK